VRTSHAGIRGVVADLVVVGDAEEVQSATDGFGEHVGGPGVAIGINGVAVEVASDPTGFGRRGHDWRLRRDLEWTPVARRTRCGVEGDGDFVLAAAWADFVGSEQDVPRAGQDRPGDIGWCGPGLGQGEGVFVAAAPAAKA